MCVQLDSFKCKAFGLRSSVLAGEAPTRIVESLIGGACDTFVRDEIAAMTSEPRWVHYLTLLRDTVWPDGAFFES